MIEKIKNMSIKELKELENIINAEITDKELLDARSWVKKFQTLIDECPYPILSKDECINRARVVGVGKFKIRLDFDMNHYIKSDEVD